MLYIANKLDYIMYTWILHKSSAHDIQYLYNHFTCSELIFEQNSHSNGVLTINTQSVNNDSMLADISIQNLIYYYDFYSNEEICNCLNTACILKHIDKQVRLKIISIVENVFSHKCKLNFISHEHRHIFVSGFGWTGSSAVYDAIRGSSDCNSLFDSGKFPNRNNDKSGVEVPLFRDKHNVWNIFTELDKSDFLFTKSVIIYFIYNILGFGIPSSLTESYTKFLNSILPIFCVSKEHILNYLNICSIFLSNLQASYFSIDKIRNFRIAIDNFLYSISSILPHRKYKYIIYDNVLPSTFADRIKMMPQDAIYLLSFRDPRDQFVSCNKYANMHVDTYINSMKHILTVLLNSYKQNKLTHRFIPVSYEYFISNQKYRKELYDKLDICITEDNNIYFNPNISIQRTKKYVDFADQDAVNKVLQNLPYLYDHSFLDNFDENFLNVVKYN